MSYHKGFFGMLEGRYMFGIKQTSNEDFLINDFGGTPRMHTNSIRGIVGHYAYSHWSAGIGFGIDTNIAPDSMTFPLFVDVRGYLWDKRHTPFAYLDLGYAVRIVQDEAKGFMTDIGVGYKYMFKQHFGLNCTVAYSFKAVDRYFILYRHSLSMGIGLVF